MYTLVFMDKETVYLVQEVAHDLYTNIAICKTVESAKEAALRAYRDKKGKARGLRWEVYDYRTIASTNTWARYYEIERWELSQ